MKNKKTLIHFTLAISLILGVFITAKSNPKKINKSKYSSYQKADYLKSSKMINQDDSDNDKTISKVKETNVSLNDLDDSISSESIADIRLNFDVRSSKQVKNVQKILGLEQDGIFGPKTDKAYQAAIAQDDIKKSSSLINVDIAKTAPTKAEAVNEDFNPLSTANTMLD